MDSVTQFMLGAGVAGAVLGPRIGAKALLIGGVVGTLPDLDSLVSMGNVIDDMTYHRGPTHSVIMQTLAAPVVAGGIALIVRSTREHWRSLWLTVWLCLVTHSILDSLTTYGTQIFWPLQLGPPVAFPAVFIIDPIYTLLLLVGAIVLALRRKTLDRGVRAMRIMLAVSTAYLALGVTGQFSVKARAEADPALAGMRLHVQPAPFNLLIWQVLAVDDDRYVSGFTSILPGCSISERTAVARMPEPPDMLDVPASVRRLEWFSDGFYTYGSNPRSVSITDLRMGSYPSFVFSFRIADNVSGSFKLIEPERLPPNRSSLLETIKERFSRVLSACL